MTDEKCEICGQNYTHSMQDHHLIPNRFGGSNQERNLVKLCANCHAALEAIYGRDFWNTVFRHFLNTVGFKVPAGFDFYQGRKDGRPPKVETEKLARVAELREKGHSYSTIARKIESDPEGPESISRETIRRYCSDLDLPENKEPARDGGRVQKQVGRPRKLEEDQLREVDDLREKGLSYSNIARLIESDPDGPESISRETIRRYCANEE